MRVAVLNSQERYVKAPRKPIQGTTFRGGGGEGVPASRSFAFRTEGFQVLAFGFALGLALVILFWLIRNYGPGGVIKEFVTSINVGFVFLHGLVGGTIMLSIYNLLVVRRLSLFALEHSAD